MTPTPSWLYYLFAVAMLAVAAYCLVLLAVSVATRRTAGWDVDIAHIFMGVSMAGMFVADWAFGPSAIWNSSSRCCVAAFPWTSHSLFKSVRWGIG